MVLCQVVWRYLLNVYPDGLSGQERMDYMKRKTREYDQLKREWTARVSLEDFEFIRGNVLKDVLRTDRAHPYYAGSEDSPHLTALTDLLTTFAITHPQVCIAFHSVGFYLCWVGVLQQFIESVSVYQIFLLNPFQRFLNCEAPPHELLES